MNDRTHGLHPTTWAVLRALRAGTSLSRNKHFYLFQDPRARRALKLHRFLDSVARDLEACGDQITVTVVDESDDRYALRIDFERLHGHRTAFLSALELRLLAEQAPAAARRLQLVLNPSLES